MITFFRKHLTQIIIIAALFAASAFTFQVRADEYVPPVYGENREITGSYDESLAAACVNGTFVGSRSGNVVSYKGIPFAKVPVGDLRWKAPVSAEPDNRVYEALYFGKTSLQPPADSERASYYEQGEDCLRLNIWKNESDPNTKKPVMVFIHGGSYGWGGTTDPLYEGTNFISAHENVILVTIGYRVGIMGFLDLSAVKGGENYPDSQNLGLLDQVKALEWIHENIAAFGGDPENVTIFGESAGAGSVSLLPLMDSAKGLFQKVIAESGSIALTYSKEECQALTEKLMDEVDAKSMDDLLALSEDDLYEATVNIGLGYNFPQRDGRILPLDLYKAYEDGASAGISMMSGTNSDECRYWIEEVGGKRYYNLAIPVLYENLLERCSREDQKRISQYMDIIDTDNNIWDITDLMNEVIFRVPAIVQSELHSRTGSPAYMYYWSYPSAIKDMGACHAVELAYVFNNLQETIYTGDNIDPILAQNVQNMWVNFAVCGDPSTDEYTWPSYDAEHRYTIILDKDISLEEDLMGQERELIEPLLKYDFNGNYDALNLQVPYIIGIGTGFAIVFICIILLIIRAIRLLSGRGGYFLFWKKAEMPVTTKLSRARIIGTSAIIALLIPIANAALDIVISRIIIGRNCAAALWRLTPVTIICSLLAFALASLLIIKGEGRRRFGLWGMLIAALAGAVICALLVIFSRSIVTTLCRPEDMLMNARSYFSILRWTPITLFVNAFLAEWLIRKGETGTVVTTAVLAISLKVVLNILMCYKREALGLGLAGLQVLALMLIINVLFMFFRGWYNNRKLKDQEQQIN